MTRNPVTFGSLFAGVGGFDLGFERAGLVCKWQVEISEFCRKVLAKHWPDVRRHDDVRTFPPKGGHSLDNLEKWRVDVICGGFPCQDISVAGRGEGIAEGTRSGLWLEYVRIVRLLRPEYVVVENVPALLVRGLDRVLGNLADIGYDAEWQTVGCDSIGGSQHRKRVWILAYPHGTRREGPVWVGQPYPPGETWAAACGEPLRSTCGYWPPGPCAVADVPRMADGPAHRMDRLKALGNAVVPQVAEWIGRRLMEAIA
jgi:DNA (cytosine-5)-methyltransferase 1